MGRRGALPRRPILSCISVHHHPALPTGQTAHLDAGADALFALRDQLGYQPTFLVIAGTVALAGVFAFFTLKKDDQEVLGDPFIRDSAKAAA